MILTFGSSNADVILQESLTSAPTAGNGLTVNGAPSYTSDGMILPTTSDHLLWASMAGHELAAWAGQISVDVDVAEVASGSTLHETAIAPVSSSNGYVISTYGTGAWNDGMSITAGGADTVQNRISINAKSGATVFASGFFYNSKILKKDTCTLTQSWVGRSFEYFVDGVSVGKHNTAAHAAQTTREWLANFMVGTNNPGAHYTGRNIKNLQLAKVPVVLAIPPVLQKAVVFGDSFANASLAATVLNYGFQAGKVQQLNRVLAENGLKINNFSLLAQGGHTVQDNGAQPLEGKRSLVAAQDPTLIIFQSAANDAGIFNAATFETDMKDHLTYFVNNCPHLRGIVVGELPNNSNSGRYGDAYAVAVNAIFNSLPAWWNTTYPALAGKLTVAKVYAAYGGLTHDTDNYGTTDTLHPGAIGMYRMGEAWGEAVLKLGQQ